MNASIIVTLVTGKVWAVSPEGEKRELKVGDTLLGNETLIVSDNAQVELDYGNNQVISFIGEQTTNVLNASNAAIEPAPPEFNLIIDDTNNSNVQENTVLIHEGHNFVQLVRIGEIIEADGINYLSVARIAEVIQSLTLNLPNRLVERDEEIETAGGDSNTFEANGDSLVTLDDSSVYEGNDITITASVNNAPVINDLILTLNNGEILTIAVGETTGSVTFTNPNSEDAYVDGEVIEYSIVSANGGKYQTLDTSSTSNVTIIDTENTSTVSLNNPTVTEGEDITLTATVDNAPQKAPLILMLSNGEIITIAIGETTGSVTFSNTNADDSYIDNSIENISISSSTGGNYELLDISAISTITVTDSVATTTISLDNPTVEEGGEITISASVDNAPVDTPLVVTLDN
ncbi:immunoglobulin-like domain-containing protein, partial [Psychromonas aquatilis]